MIDAEIEVGRYGVAEHISGPLSYEQVGRGAHVVLFIHPNPMDRSSWVYQMAHLSTWYRCVAVDLPGYGRSPAALEGLTMTDMAQACWEALDDARVAGPAILVGCSVGAWVIPYMYRLRPDRTAAIVLSGAGYRPPTEFTTHRIRAYEEKGIAYRWEYTLEDFGPAFRTTPLARYFADIFSERNELADLPSILRQFRALEEPQPADLHDIDRPALIVSGSEDAAHPSAFRLKDRLPRCELEVIPGAGHACHMEQPWLFDELLLGFLDSNGMLPGGTPRRSSER